MSQTPRRLRAPAIGLASSLLLVPGCFRPPPTIDPPEGGSSSGEDGSSGSQDSTTGIADGSTSSDPMGSTDDDGSGSTSADGSTTDEPPACTDACDPESTEVCTPEGDGTQTCTLDDEGCYQLETSPCGGGELCGDGGCALLPTSCAEQLAMVPGSPDGAYLIDPDGAGALGPVEVLCDMSNDGGGWTLIAYNDETTTFVEFDRSWQQYKDGFGDLAGGQLGWLGNDRMHAMTQGGTELQVRHDQGLNVYASFGVGDEASLYTLTVASTPQSQDGGNFAGYHSGLPFSTFDNDNSAIGCPGNHYAGWWFDDCFAVSIAASGDPDPAQGHVYWRLPPNTGAPAYVEWIGMWIR